MLGSSQVFKGLMFVWWIDGWARRAVEADCLEMFWTSSHCGVWNWDVAERPFPRFGWSAATRYETVQTSHTVPVTMNKWTLVSLVTSTSLRSQRGQIYLENHEIPSSCSNLKPAVTSASGVLDIEFVWAHRITLVISTGVCKLLRVLLALTRHRKEKTNHLSGYV